MADSSPHQLAGSITCHAWNGGGNMVALCPNSSDLLLFRASLQDEFPWTKLHTLSKHEQVIADVDWAHKSNRIVTCSHDRNAYVWEQKDGSWHPQLVILRLNRAALSAAWSPKENKFAVGSGSATVSICYYEEDNNWWVSKTVKKKHSSSVTSVAWHPNNVLLATTCTDGKCRVFSTSIKGLDPSGATSFGDSKFGEQLLELDVASGWSFGACWSPSGANLAFVAHDSSIHLVTDFGPSLSLHSLPLKHLPLRTALFLSDRLIVAAGFDGNPLLFASDASGNWSFVRVLDEAKMPPTPGMAGTPNKFSAASFEMLRRSDAFDIPPSSPMGMGMGGGGFHTNQPGSVESCKVPQTVHQNCIISVRPIPPLGSSTDIIQSFSTAGLDGKVVVWDVSGLHLAHVLKAVHL